MIEVDALVIQGPTTYCKEVTEYYKDYKQIWSTWNSEPKENLDYLQSLSNVSLITDDLPVLSIKEKSGSGHGPWCLERALYQWTSTLNGFDFANQKGYTFCPKIRSDFLIDLDAALVKCDPDAFNSLGWHKGSVGYLVDYFYLAKTKDIMSMLECCISMRIPAHAENIMTYAWIEWSQRRNLKYCLDEYVYTYSLKHKYTTKLFMGEVAKGIWIVDNNQHHDSKNYLHTFTKDNLPDKYPLIYGWGPGV